MVTSTQKTARGAHMIKGRCEDHPLNYYPWVVLLPKCRVVLCDQDPSKLFCKLPIKRLSPHLHPIVEVHLPSMPETLGIFHLYLGSWDSQVDKQPQCQYTYSSWGMRHLRLLKLACPRKDRLPCDQHENRATPADCSPVQLCSAVSSQP